MNSEDNWSETKNGGISARGVQLGFSLSDNVFSCAVNEQRRRLERNKIAAFEHQMDTFDFFFF